MTPRPPVPADRLSNDGQLSGGGTVIRVQISTELQWFEQHWQHLNDAEHARAGRLRVMADRRRFVVARSILRQLLGHWLGSSPARIAFATGPFGKPVLRDQPAALHFNLSHSGDWILIACDRRAPVGIDVEKIRPDMADMDPFRPVLATEEWTVLQGLPRQQRARAFAINWVRKEAYVKALGEGMSRSLDDICITTDRDGQPRLGYDRVGEDSIDRWRFADIDIDDEHVGCLVYRDHV